MEKQIQIPDKQKIEIEAKKQQENEFKLMGRMRLIPGLTLYEFDYNLMELHVKEIITSKTINIVTEKENENKKAFNNPHAFLFQCHSPKAAVKKANKLVKKALEIENYFKIENKEFVKACY